MNFILQFQDSSPAPIFDENAQEPKQRNPDNEKDKEGQQFVSDPVPCVTMVSGFRENILLEAHAGTGFIGEEIKLRVARNFRMLLEELSQVRIDSVYIFLVTKQRGIATKNGG